MPDRYLAIAVFVASIVITSAFRLALPARFDVNESSDFISYYEPVARNLASGRGLVRNDDEIALIYPPGYPMLLACIYWVAVKTGGPETLLTSIFLLACIGLSAVAVYFLAKIRRSPLAAAAIALVWATYPFWLWLTKQPNSEIPFIPVFFFGLYLLLNGALRANADWRNYFPAGLLIGFSMLIRPIAIGSWIIAALIIWIAGNHLSFRLRLRSVCLLLAGVLITVAPWEAWVFAKTGRLVSVSDNGPLAMRGGLVFAAVEKPYRQRISVPDDVLLLMQDVLAHYPELKTKSDISRFLGNKLKEDPIAVIKLFAIKALRSWYGTDIQKYEWQILLLQIPYLIFILLGSLIWWRRGNADRKLVVCIWLMVIYFWGMTILVTSTLRYMVPSMGLLFTLLPIPSRAEARER